MDADERLLTVKKVRAEAALIRSFLLARPHGKPLPSWQPGAHIDVRLPSGALIFIGEPERRPGCHDAPGVLSHRRPLGGGEQRRLALHAWVKHRRYACRETP